MLLAIGFEVDNKSFFLLFYRWGIPDQDFRSLIE